MIRGAIFDMDGLLFDTEIVFENCWKKVGAEMGLLVSDEFTHACCGCGRNGLPDVIRRFFPDADAPTYAERVIELAFETQLAAIPVLKPGVLEMLAKCRAKGVRTAVASSSSRDVVEHNLSAAGLTDLFDAIVTGSEVAHGKPAPDIFLLAAERIGIAPTDCAVFEDAVTGIRAAKAAGCLPVMIPDRIRPTEEILGICTCRPSLLEALDLI